MPRVKIKVARGFASPPRHRLDFTRSGVVLQAKFFLPYCPLGDTLRKNRYLLALAATEVPYYPPQVRLSVGFSVASLASDLSAPCPVFVPEAKQLRFALAYSVKQNYLLNHQVFSFLMNIVVEK